MQIKDKCEFCTKSQIILTNVQDKIQFGCNASYCVFDPIVENKYREQVKTEYKNFCC